MLGGLLENVADSVSNGGLEGYASRVESRKVYANELAWLEDCVRRQMFTLSQGKCKSAAPGTTPLPPWATGGGLSTKSSNVVAANLRTARAKAILIGLPGTSLNRTPDFRWLSG